MLSTTNQPRSSRALADVLRPAPDIPVRTSTSGWSSGCTSLVSGETSGVSGTGPLWRTPDPHGSVAQDLAGGGVDSAPEA